MHLHPAPVPLSAVMMLGITQHNLTVHLLHCVHQRSCMHSPWLLHILFSRMPEAAVLCDICAGPGGILPCSALPGLVL